MPAHLGSTCHTQTHAPYNTVAKRKPTSAPPNSWQPSQKYSIADRNAGTIHRSPFLFSCMTNRLATTPSIRVRPPGFRLRLLRYGGLEPVRRPGSKRRRVGGQAEAIWQWGPPAIVSLAAMAALTALTAAPSADAAANQSRPARAVEATAPRSAG